MVDIKSLHKIAYKKDVNKYSGFTKVLIVFFYFLSMNILLCHIQELISHKQQNIFKFCFN